MLPTDLKPERFNSYPPEARKLVTANIATLQRLPLTFLPSLLREAIDYDFKFPAERKALEKELSKLGSLPLPSSTTGFRDSQKFTFLRRWKTSIGSVRRRSLLKICPLTCGPLINWMHSARRRRSMETVCTKRFHQNLLDTPAGNHGGRPGGFHL